MEESIEPGGIVIVYIVYCSPCFLIVQGSLEYFCIAIHHLSKLIGIAAQIYFRKPTQFDSIVNHGNDTDDINAPNLTDTPHLPRPQR